jgi:hypothetical protein
MLFLLAMEPLHRLFQRAQQVGLISPLSKGCDSFRVSLYADAAAMFIKPNSQDMEVTDCILSTFAEASGLITNMSKTEFYPIQCMNTNLDFLEENNKKIAEFPCTYLGLPLHYKKLPRALFDQVVQKVDNRLPGWKRKFLTYPGRELLVKFVLTAMPTYFFNNFQNA